MPSYTHLQRAEPVLVAHWLLAYVQMILRDASRLQERAIAIGDMARRRTRCAVYPSDGTAPRKG